MRDPAEALLIPRGRYSNEMRAHVTRRESDFIFFVAHENLPRRFNLSRHRKQLRRDLDSEFVFNSH
jgi:hypothetical protein